ncbi:MAG: hypothetical protein Q9220_005750 [cf. Caloplaca sp. 1 TL-2023]
MDPYHLTNLPTKYPLPLALEKPDSHFAARLATVPGLLGVIESILHHEHDIDCRNLFSPDSVSYDITFDMISKPGYHADLDKPRPGVTIFLALPDHISGASMCAAEKDISDMLAENGLEDLILDIQDPSRCYIPCQYPIRSTDPHTSFYRSIREELLAVVRTAIPRLWVSMGLYYVGSTWGGAVPSVALQVKPRAVHDWQALYVQMKSIIESRQPPDISLDVDIFPGQYGQSEDRPGVDFHESFTPAPKIGSSIGVRDGKGGGTLGGFFTLRIGQNVHNGFLTTSNVVAPREAADPAVHEHFEKNGVRLTTPQEDDTRSVVQYLAQKDNDATMESILQENRQREGYVDDDGNIHQGWIGELDEKIKQGDKDARYLERSKQYSEDKVRRNHINYRYLEQMPLTLGKTLYASGKAVNHRNRIMNWAFVSCSGTSGLVDGTYQNLYDPEFGNRIPTEKEMEPAPDKYFNGYSWEHMYIPCEDNQMRGFGRIKPDRWYFKTGRSTGLTAGICNGIETYINLEETYYQHDDQGKIINTSSDYAEEWVILNAHADRHYFTSDSASRWDKKTFCDEGDCGSLVIDYQGRPSGMIFGALNGFVGPDIPVIQYTGPGPARGPNVYISCGEKRTSSYMGGVVADIREIMDDIKFRTSFGSEGLAGVLEIPEK